MRQPLNARRIEMRIQFDSADPPRPKLEAMPVRKSRMQRVNRRANIAVLVITAASGGCQPSLWCDWVPTEDRTGIEWDDGEKFYNYVVWLEYLIANFLGPWGYKVNGEVTWQGEDHGDHGTIVVLDGSVWALQWDS